MAELIVLHERAVDDRHAEVEVEQDRHRLELADDDVAEDTQEREDPLGVGDAPAQLAPHALPFLAQPLDDRYDTIRSIRTGWSAMSSSMRVPPSRR